MKKHRPDYILAIIVGILLIFGISVLASVSAVFSQEKFGETTHYLFHQLIWGVGPGIFLGFIALKIKLSFFKKWAWIFLLMNLIFMGLVFVPGLGEIHGGAARWLNFRFFTFQPSEFLKLTFIIYLSAWLASRGGISFLKSKKKKGSSTFLPFLVVIGVITVLLIYQLDLSTLGIILVSAVLIYFCGGTPIWQAAFLVFTSAGMGYFLIKLFPYRLNRILVWLNYIKDPMGIGYQLKQALIAVGSGGIFGLGLGMSHQKFGFVPQTMSDSIFAIIAEELGFIGCLFLVIAFLVFLWRGFRISKKSSGKFSRLLALGITCWITLQAFVNMGAMIGAVPLTGIPLPFISYGGSHIVAELIGIGLLLNISKSQRK